MLRCVSLVLAMAALPSAAQAPRNFPATALRGALIITQPPEVMLNGAATRLAPGARIRDENNMMALSGAIAGRKLMVHYTRDINGHLKDVWLLTATERAREPWPTSEAQAKSWVFDPAGQFWSRP